VVLFHDDTLTPPQGRGSRAFGRAGRPPIPSHRVCELTLKELRAYSLDRNPDPRRFREQDPSITPVARTFGWFNKLYAYTLPTLDDLFAFVAFYASEEGRSAGKTDEQRERAARLVFDLELKRVPAHPEFIGDGFDGSGPAALERETVAAVRRAGVVERTVVRSFDHRAVRAVKALEPALRTAVLVASTAPVDPARLARDAGAEMYCPEVAFLDRRTVDQLHNAGIAVVPWTVNEPEEWDRLLDWGVDGITTDYPDRLATLLRERGVDW
jgi:glycerophosphoryl diester phosphodiesterase